MPFAKRLLMSLFFYIANVRTGAVLSAALVGACSSPAVAPFSELDRDGDGRISQQEATHDVVLAGAFTDVDMDENGELTPFEYLQAANRR